MFTAQAEFVYRPRWALVLAAFLAEAEREAALRCCAAACACLDSARGDAAALPSFFMAAVLARERVGEMGSCRCPFS